MYQDLRIAVVVPAFCESPRIAETVKGIPDWVDHVIAVDDASTDETYEVLTKLSDTRLMTLRLRQNLGVGGAGVTGFVEALNLNADVIVKMDGDGQMDPRKLEALIGPIHRREADYVKGSRFVHTRELERMPWVRRIGNIGLSFLTKLASGYWSVFDPSNGYIAIHSTVARLLDSNRLDKRFFFESSLLLELGLHRAVVRDVYIPARYGDKISSLSERKAFFQFPPLLFKGFLRRLLIQYFVRDFNAVSLFLVVGLASTVFGFLWGAYHWITAVQSGINASTGTVMIAVLPIILGIQLLLQAAVLDIQNTPTNPLH